LEVFTDQRYGTQRSVVKPLRFVSLITTYRCGFRCHMCNIWKYPTASSSEITASDLAACPDVRTINVTGGEPFLRDDLADILSVLRPKTRRLVISTSGYYTDRVIEIARRHPWIGVRISVEGFPAVNDDLRGMPNAFEHALRTLTELAHLKVPDIGFGITLSDRNGSSLIPLYHLAKMMRVEFATAAVHNSFYFHKSDNRICNEESVVKPLQELIRELLDSSRPKEWFRAYFNWGLVNYVRGNPRVLPCEMGEDSCFIDPYGEVLPCNGMQEPVSFGNIREKPFQELWAGPRAQDIRNMVKTCPRACWMMGSAAEPIKKRFLVVLRWVLAQKFGKSLPSVELTDAVRAGRCR
jgi:Fe-coproporphyrin III synthase